MNSADIQPLIASCRIAHHIPGRLRLKIDFAAVQDLGIPLEDATALFERLEKTDGLRKISINRLARSCTVEYDSQIIPPAAWDDLAAGIQSQAADDLLARFTESTGQPAPSMTPQRKQPIR